MLFYLPRLFIYTNVQKRCLEKKKKKKKSMSALLTRCAETAENHAELSSYRQLQWPPIGIVFRTQVERITIQGSGSGEGLHSDEKT